MMSTWYKDSILELNVHNTKELSIDFRTSGPFDIIPLSHFSPSIHHIYVAIFTVPK